MYYSVCAVTESRPLCHPVGLPLDKQKLDEIKKQKPEEAKKIKDRNAERAKRLGRI